MTNFSGITPQYVFKLLLSNIQAFYTVKFYGFKTGKTSLEVDCNGLEHID